MIGSLCSLYNLTSLKQDQSSDRFLGNKLPKICKTTIFHLRITKITEMDNEYLHNYLKSEHKKLVPGRKYEIPIEVDTLCNETSTFVCYYETINFIYWSLQRLSVLSLSITRCTQTRNWTQIVYVSSYVSDINRRKINIQWTEKSTRKSHCILVVQLVRHEEINVTWFWLNPSHSF